MKSETNSYKRKKESINHEVPAKSTSNGVDTLPVLGNKRSKIEVDQSVDTGRHLLSIWVCQDRQLDKRTFMKFDRETRFIVLLKTLCEVYHQSVDEAVLFLQYADGTWSEINPTNDNTILSEIDIEQLYTISLERKESVEKSTNVKNHFHDIDGNADRITCLTVKCTPIDQEMQIECNLYNDTVHMLKEKIFAQLPPESDYKLLQLFVDAKLMDQMYDDRTLASLNISSASSITVDMRRKLKVKHSIQLVKNNGRCGLRNLGHTCYMNSALQSLSHVLQLTDFFLQHQDIEGDVAQAYADFIRNVWGSQKLFEPRRIKTIMSKYAPEFAGFNQEDAHEFMTFLLSQLHTDLKQQQSTSIISDLFYGRVNGITTCLNCGYVRSTPNTITFIPVSLDANRKKRQFNVSFEPIHPNILTVETDASGNVENLVQAFLNKLQLQCEFETEGLFRRVQILSKRTDRELTIETPLSSILDTDLQAIEHNQDLRELPTFDRTSQHTLELIDCIRDFEALELPQSLWFCKSECQRAVHAAKQMKFDILPPVMIIQLRRFITENKYRRKLHTFIKFPLNNLDLNEFVLDQQTTMLYDLVAVVNHIGTTMDSGHYTTYARQLTDSTGWFSFDDEHISSIEEKNIVSRNAYLLIYARHD